MPTTSKILFRLDACDDALAWVVVHPGKTHEQLWNLCDRPDWLLWLAEKVQVDPKRFMLASIECAKTVTHLLPTNEGKQILDAIEKHVWDDSAFGRNEIGKAKHDSNRLEVAIEHGKESSAATAIACAAYTAWWYQGTGNIRSSGRVAEFAAEALNSDDDRLRSKKLSDLVRTHIPWEVIRDALENTNYGDDR